MFVFIRSLAVLKKVEKSPSSARRYSAFVQLILNSSHNLPGYILLELFSFKLDTCLQCLTLAQQ